MSTFVDLMRTLIKFAVKENWDIAVEKNLTYRNACFVNAIGKVHREVNSLFNLATW